MSEKPTLQSVHVIIYRKGQHERHCSSTVKTAAFPMSAVAMYVLDELIERDAGTRIDGSRHDLLVLRLEEHSGGGGYLWDMDQLEASGFAVVRDRLEAADREGIGGPVIRRGTAASPDAYRGSVLLAERRLWEPGPRYGRYGRKSDIISGNHVRRLV